MTRPATALRAVALGAVSLAFAAATTVPAGATTPTVGIGVARTNISEHGTFTVPVWTDAASAQITSVTVAIRESATVVANPTMTDGGNGFWSPSAPLQLATDGGVMPHLGQYAIDVTAHDSVGNSLTRDDAGTLDFTLRPVFGPMPSASLGFTNTPELANQSTAATGTLLGIRPGTSATVPLTSRDVTVTRAYTPDIPTPVADEVLHATTDASGNFATTSFGDQQWWAWYTASFTEADSTVDGSASVTSSPATQQTAVVITASASAPRVEPGRHFTISGTVHAATATGPGVANAPVVVGLNSYGTVPGATAITDASGNFTADLVAVQAVYPDSPTWSVTPSSIYLTGDPLYKAIIIPDEATFTSVSITLNSAGRVSAKAFLGDTFYSPGVWDGQAASLQYSPNGSSGWSTLASGKSLYGNVSLSAWGYINGYYRLYHPVSDQLAHTYSNVVHLSRIVTRVESNNAAPEPVHKGATITVTGILQYQGSATWHPMGSRTIYLYFEPSGSTIFYEKAAGKTDATGHAKLHAIATKSGKWLLQYFGDSTHFDSYATPDYVALG